jgi:two-component system, LytTR family, response regulator
MLPIKALALDDEPLALRVLANHAAKIPFLEWAHQTTNAVDALMRIQQGDIQLLFLDIQMPDLTGIQFMQLIKGQSCKVILTTAYAQYALEGYEYDVIDYLLKPISFDRFLKSVQKAQQLLQVMPLSAPPITIDNQLVTPIDPIPMTQDFIFIKTEYRLQRVQHSDILFIEGGKDYSTIHTLKERILSLTSLTKLQEMLPTPPFLRVHKSWLVAVNKIDSVERQRIFMGKTIIPIGDTYKDAFMKVVGGDW